MKSIRTLLNKLLEIFCVITFAFLTLLTTWQVLTRYLLDNPSTWSEELASYMFAWVTLLGAAYVFGKREHMNIPVITDRFKVATQHKIAIINEIIVFIFSATIMIMGGLRITSLTMGQMSASLNMPMGYFYMVIPISGIFICLYNILNLYGLFNKEIGPEALEDAKVDQISLADNQEGGQ